MLLEVLNHSAPEALPELQQVVKNIITGQFEQTFGCTLDQHYCTHTVTGTS